MQVLLTGSSGYVGSAALRMLRTRGHDVLRLHRAEEADSGEEDAVYADLSDFKALREAAGRVDAVIHCAASDDPDFWPVSQAAAEALINGLSSGGRFAAHGGTIVFGDTGLEPADPPTLAPPPPLARRAELDQSILAQTGRGIVTHMVYGAFVYGRGRRAALPNLLVDAAKAAGAALYVGNGDQIWATVHIDDFGALLVDAVESASAEGGPLFAADAPIRMRDMADRIGSAFGLPTRQATEEEADRLFGSFASALGLNQNFDTARTQAVTDWSPRASSPAALDHAIADLASTDT